MVLVGTPNGVVKVNCIKRLPMNQAKDPELLKCIRGYPWRLTPGDVQNEPGEVPTMVASEPVVPEGELPPASAERAGGRSCTQAGVHQAKS